jgi:glycosyltransferase involved in cell wall biosynthesis
LKKLSSLSAFFPAYNEEASITEVYAGLKNVLPRITDDYEIIAVNDGSRDKTGAIAESLAGRDQRFRVIHHEQNRGYGAAIRSGILASGKDYVFYMDGDNQFDATQLVDWPQYLDHYDAVIGYRINRQDPRMRRLNAWAWNKLIGAAFGIKVRDVDCAFKLIRAGVFAEISLGSSGAMVSTELLVKMQKEGFTFREVGVFHSPRRHGKSTGGNPRVIFKAFKELYRLRRSKEWKG